MKDEVLTEMELRIVDALRMCPDSEIGREYPYEEGLTLAQIAALYGVTYECVRRLEMRALDHVRMKLTEEAYRARGRRCRMGRREG